MALLAIQIASAASFGVLVLFAGYQAGQLKGADVPGEGPVVPSPFLATSISLPAKAQGAVPEGGGPKDFDVGYVPDVLLSRLRSAIAVESTRTVHSLSAAGAKAAHLAGTGELQAASAELLGGLSEAFDPTAHAKLRRALELLSGANDRAQQLLAALLPPAAERLALEAPGGGGQRPAAPQRGPPANKPQPPPPPPVPRFAVSVRVLELPFGMRLRGGTLMVEEVFPGFPAHKAGIRRGCTLEQVSGRPVTPGTWMEEFQASTPPFSLDLDCGATTRPAMTQAAAPPPAPSAAEAEDPRRFRVSIREMPDGMNIQVVGGVPRVVEVLPGFPAEAAGVRAGFALVAVRDTPVDSSNWFREYQTARIPYSLTFDTQAPALPVANRTVEDEAWPALGFEDFRCDVRALPFGMLIKAKPGRRPRVGIVLPRSPASRAKVQVNDVLIEVAGRPVTWATWFAAMQQARPPYGLLFRRPLPDED